MPIKVLEHDMVSRIAAGEVVERPASVVKELIENSLDAGATAVSVEVRGGGVSLIRVSDNGVGIPAPELPLAFQRHATSKVETPQDLAAIATLGFRGEALPSIAACAEVEVVTRTPGEVAGAYVRLLGGVVVEEGGRGSPQGTVVTVHHLFRDHPARLKFLKPAATESGHISHIVGQYALAFPEVRFTLTVDGRRALVTAGSGRLGDVLVEVYGADIAGAMVPVVERDGVPRVTGHVSRPELTRSSRSHMSFFVNRRFVRSRVCVRAVEEAYRGLLMTGRYPVAVLTVWLPREEVDVNVHPAKVEVKFRSEREVFEVVQRAVREALVEEMAVPAMRGAPRAPAPPLPPTRRPSPLAAAQGPPPAAPAGAELGLRLPILRVLGQLLQTYIVAEGPDGLYLVDQHAAHERILFERVRSQRERGEVEVQGLLEPLAVELMPRQAETLLSEGECLASYGFAVEPFGERTCLVRAVPAALARGEVVTALVDILDALGQVGEPDTREERIAQSLACHSAVRAGQALSMEEMRHLLGELELAHLPHTCPHGRPTMVCTSIAQLERDFGRSL